MGGVDRVGQEEGVGQTRRRLQSAVARPEGADCCCCVDLALTRLTEGSFAETMVFRQRSDSRESLATITTFTLGATIGVHSFMAAQVGELRVGLVAHFALEGLDRRVDVRVLLETRGGGEGLAAFAAGVGARTFVVRTNVTLEVGRVAEEALANVATVSALLGDATTTNGRFRTVEGLGLFRMSPETN